MASLKQIAEEAGVSVRTVGRALRENGYVRADIREKVRLIADRLGYRPDPAAVRLRTGRSYVMSVVVPSTDELYMSKVEGFETYLRDRNYTVDLLFQPKTRDAEGVARELRQRRPAGVFLLSQGRKDSTAGLLNQLASSNTPLVLFDQSYPEVDGVFVDRQQGVYDAVQYLIESGRQHIAYLGFEREASRLDGYRRALAEAGRAQMVIDPTGYAPEGEQYDWGRIAGRRLLDMAIRPDAIQCYTDIVAMGLLAGLAESGLRAPDDIAVIGFDDRRMAAYAAPPLTTVGQPNHQLGQAAAEILLQRIEGDESPPGSLHRVLPTQLIKRASA